MLAQQLHRIERDRRLRDLDLLSCLLDCGRCVWVVRRYLLHRRLHYSLNRMYCPPRRHTRISMRSNLTTTNTMPRIHHTWGGRLRLRPMFTTRVACRPS